MLFMCDAWGGWVGGYLEAVLGRKMREYEWRGEVLFFCASKK